MDQKLGPIALGIGLIIFGVAIIMHPVWYSGKYQFTWDYTSEKWYFGGFLIMLGGYFIVSSLRKKK
jgi:hypothetical protein